jgi:murein L,D-transpeptidase YcbB/YkuD
MDDARAQAAPIRSYRPRGGHSAAGRIRFDIPGKLLIMQSVAPDSSLFTKTERIRSRALMIVEDAEQYAQVLLSIARPEGGFTVESIRGLYGDSEQIIPFQHLIPVHVTYQTAFTDDSGQLQIRPDIYGYDRDMIALLRGDRRIVDDQRKLVPAGKPAAARRPARSSFPFPWD